MNKKLIITALILITLFLTSGRCSLEEDILLDRQFIKTESKMDGTFLMKNKESDYIVYIVGVSNEFDSQIAIDTATARARGALSRQMRQKTAELLTTYLQSVGGDPSSEHFTALVDSVSHDIGELALYKSESERVYEDKVSDPHTFFVLVKFDIDIIKNNLEKLVNPVTEHYIKLNTTKSMFELRAYILGWNTKNFDLQEKVIK
jgi:hypothetical protein